MLCFAAAKFANFGETTKLLHIFLLFSPKERIKPVYFRQERGTEKAYLQFLIIHSLKNGSSIS